MSPSLTDVSYRGSGRSLGHIDEGFLLSNMGRPIFYNKDRSLELWGLKTFCEGVD